MTPPITCGLEIHQQIDTKKLFCNCPSKITDKKPDYTLVRTLRAVSGELGEIDIAAAAQAAKGKKYHYQGYNENCCLIELDEEPPRELRLETLKIGIQVAKLLNAHLVDELQVMRKTIIDGSNTSGFQRTALLGVNGTLPCSFGTISISNVIIEEDSSRIITETPESTTFSLDRLGIPLLEISTGPDIHSPEQCSEVAEKIGLLLRSCHVKRGLGTIRQDVNVSIPLGNRVEIKGAQDLKLLPTLVTFEAQRQEHLLAIKETLLKRGVKRVHSSISDLSTLLKNTQSRVLQSALTSQGHILGIRVLGFREIFGQEIQKGKRFGSECSERAKHAAGVLGIFHSDELPNYGITTQEITLISQHLELGPQDAFVLVADTKTKAEQALYSVITRCQEAIFGVPLEVRKAHEDGTTSYLRMIPGAARMYPETDIFPIPITKELITSIKIPELIENKIARYEKLGLGLDLAELVASGEEASLFDQFTSQFKKLKPAYIAEILMTSAKIIRRQNGIEINPSPEDFQTLFFALENERISKESINDILKENKPIKEILHKYTLLSETQLQEELQKIVSLNKELPFNALIGKAMTTLRGKASGQKIAEILKKLAKQ